jgi:hypothetical protein
MLALGLRICVPSSSMQHQGALGGTGAEGRALASHVTAASYLQTAHRNDALRLALVQDLLSLTS